MLNKLRNEVLNPAIPIPDPKVRHNQPLNNWQLGIIMIIYLVGAMISILAFLAELLKIRETRPKPVNASELNDIRDADEQMPTTQIVISTIE